jgi:hypothetical protein
VRENKRYDKEGEIWREKRDWRKKGEERQRDWRKKGEERQREKIKLAEKGYQERNIE